MLKMVELLNVELQLCDGEEQQVVLVCMLVVIDENNCIGCIKCIQVCLVDVIVGVMCVMYMVMSDFCIGCNLCVDLCLMYCIELCLVNEMFDSWKWDLNIIFVCIIFVE